MVAEAGLQGPDVSHDLKAAHAVPKSRFEASMSEAVPLVAPGTLI
jgi:hypothetical protein